MNFSYRTSAISRERNRMHARKTRQRKKEHMMNLQNRAVHLKKEQVRIRQVINEKHTANILVGLFSTNETAMNTEEEDPKIEKLLQRPLESIPDASKIPELPALILPGQHNSRKRKTMDDTNTDTSQLNVTQHSLPDDGIDYKLLGKDRSKCTPAELDQIRRERNRMHAKRTRDRKRLFMEEMEDVIRKLEAENALLQNHLISLGGEPSTNVTTTEPPLVTPKITPAKSTKERMYEGTAHNNSKLSHNNKQSLCSESNGVKSISEEVPEHKQQFVTQLKSLLIAASVFDQPKFDRALSSRSSSATVTTAISSTTNTSADSSFTEEISEHCTFKRQRVETCIPQSITTSSTVSQRVKIISCFLDEA